MDKYEKDKMKKIIDYFLTQRVNTLGKLFGQVRTGKCLIASLYSLLETADPTIKEAVLSIVVDLKKEMNDDDILLLLRHFPEVIRYCYTDDIQNTRSEILTKDYTDLIRGLSDFSHDERILLPLGEIYIAASFPEHKFDIVETTEVGKALAQIVSTILNLDVRIFSSLEEVPEKKYAKIIAITPDRVKEGDEIANSIITSLSNYLNEECDCILLLPRKACYSKDWKWLRENLVENVEEFLTVCLSLSIDQKRTIFGDECLMVITKNSPSPLANKWRKVILGDFSGVEYKFNDELIGPYGVKIQSILESLREGDNDTKAVPIEKLDEGYNFLAPRYNRNEALLMKAEKAEKLTELRELVSIIGATNYVETYAPNPSFKVITERALSETYLACTIDTSSVRSMSRDDVNLTPANGGYYSYTGGEGLVGKILDKADDDTIGIEYGIIHFQVKDANVCSLDYILKELTADYVNRQVSCFVRGLAMEDRLTVDDFLSVKIILPSLKEQNESLFEDSKKGYDKKTLELAEALKDFQEDMHMKKHAIGQTIFAVNNGMKLLKIARKEGNGILKDDAVVGKKHQMTVSEIFDSLEASIRRLKIQISTLDTGHEFVPTEICVGNFIQTFIDSHQSSEFEFKDQTNLRCTYDWHVPVECEPGDERKQATEIAFKKGDDLYIINFPEEALEIILDNIVANACSHGFIYDDKAYYIRFRAEIHGNYLSLYISNNGAPLHKDLESSSVFKYGNTTSSTMEGHYGIGGYQIWKLMKEYEGRCEVISTPKEEFTVTYKLTFPLANIIETVSFE